MIFKNAELHNIAELKYDEVSNDYIMCRIPFELREKLNGSAQKRSLAPAGGEIRFNLLDGEAKILLRFIEERGVNKGQPVIVEAYQGCYRMGCYNIGENPTEIILRKHANTAKLAEISKLENHPFDANLIRLLLPDTTAVRLIDISGDISLPRPEQLPETRYLAYGSSITNGSFSLIPSSTYTTRTAAGLGVDLINLGFGGGAHLEREIADYIAERKDWDFATLEMGINLINKIEESNFDERVRYFINKISSLNPDKWIFCIDLFTFREDYDPAAYRGKHFREIVKKAVEDLNMPKVVHIDGRTLLRNASGLSPDLVHPTDSGFNEIAENLVKIIRTYINR